MNYAVHGIPQARTLECVAVPFSRGSSQPRDRTQISHTEDELYQLSHQGCPRILEWVTSHVQLCVTPIDGSPTGSSVPGILQARTLEWVAISFSNAWKWKVKVKSLNRVRRSVTPWTAAYQAPPSMGFSRQEYWSGVPLPSPNPSLRSLNSMINYYNHSLGKTLNSLVLSHVVDLPWWNYNHG